MTDVGVAVLLVAILLLIAALLLVVYCRQRRAPQPGPQPGPALPEACTVPPDRVGNVLKGVYAPGRLRVLADCAVAEGIATEVHHEPDGDVHIRLTPDPKYAPLVNVGQDFIICEIIPMDQAIVREPQVGQHVHVEGPWCFDTIHGWNEIHPVWLLRVI